MKTYMPTDDDVIRARLRTLGVQEYRFIFDHGVLPSLFLPEAHLTVQKAGLWVKSGGYMMSGAQEAVYGHRHHRQFSCKLTQPSPVPQRAAWYPYFDDGKS